MKKIRKLLKEYVLILIYILIINVLLSFSTISLHELGHFLVGLISGCKNIMIILFDTKNFGTYTSMNCDPGVNVNLIALGPLLFLTPFSMLFLLIKKPEKFYGLMILGLNFIINISDMQKITKSSFVYILEIAAGFSLIIYSEILIINYILCNKK